MTRLLLSLLLPLFMGAELGAQTPYNSEKTAFFTIALPFSATSQAPLPRSITVVDKRFDTAKIGFGWHGSKQKMIRLQGGTAGGVELYLNGRTAGNNHPLPNLLVVLRTLWLHELKAGELKEAGEELEKQNISRGVARFDVYSVQEGTCRALVRIDTTFETGAYLKPEGGSLLAGILDHVLQKIGAMNVGEATAKKTPIKFDELMALYDRKSALPRLKNDTIQRGIYLSFSDFVQNRPKQFNFVLEQDEGGDYLYITENGEQRLFTDFWGFCDGKLHFIRLGTNFFPLVRDGNTYSFLGCLQPVHNAQPRSRNRVGRYALLGVFGELHRTRLVNLLRPMQLNMETGEAY